MEYRMYSGTIPAGKNLVKIIQKHLEETENLHLPHLNLDFVGFEASAGTEIYLNKQKDPIKVPSGGSFTTPYNGIDKLTIRQFYFKEDFTGNIYFII